MKIINIGILAHVDAGKTTLTESLLYTSGAILELGSVDKGTTRTDTMFLERQRGITIQAAVTSFNWNDYKINIVDTPGHADFSSEVERIIQTVDTVILLVDSAEGPMPQTRFVLQKALEDKENITFLKVNGKRHNPNYTADAVAYKDEFFAIYKKELKKKRLTTDAEKAWFVKRFDGKRMTEQDMTLWKTIFDFLA